MFALAMVPSGAAEQEIVVLLASSTDATLLNEKFVNVAVMVATPNFAVASPSVPHRPPSSTSADEITATRHGLATPPPNHAPADWRNNTWTRVCTSTWSLPSERWSMARLAVPILSARTPYTVGDVNVPETMPSATWRFCSERNIEPRAVMRACGMSNVKLGAARVADHLGADAVHGRRRERAGDDAVGDL